MTGRAPGRPRQTGQVCVLGASGRNSVVQPQKSFVRVRSCVWTSSPTMTVYAGLEAVAVVELGMGGCCGMTVCGAVNAGGVGRVACFPSILTISEQSQCSFREESVVGCV